MDAMPSHRAYTAADRLLLNADRVLRTVLGGAHTARRPSPAGGVVDGELSPADRREAVALLRVDHAGEVAAQALYHGQALTARHQEVRASMEQAAREETDHLVWCEGRLAELGGQRSRLTPLWYLGSLAVGAVAGAAGDRWSLGFLVETEHQVERHLDGHLERLPAGDRRSRAILAQMREDEGHHAQTALDAGAAPLPAPVRGLMRWVSRVMTRTAYWI